MKNQFHQNSQQIEDDHSLILKAQSDIDKFEPLYNKYFEQIFRFAYQRVERKEEASDITSQVFLKAMVNLKKYKFKGIPFSAWLIRIAINEVNDYYLKTKKSRMVNVEITHLNQIVEDTLDEIKEERINQILELLKGLPDRDLMIIEMRYFEDRSFKEIAEILRITENNAKVRVYRVLDQLKLQIH